MCSDTSYKSALLERTQGGRDGIQGCPVYPEVGFKRTKHSSSLCKKTSQACMHQVVPSEEGAPVGLKNNREYLQYEDI